MSEQETNAQNLMPEDMYQSLYDQFGRTYVGRIQIKADHEAVIRCVLICVEHMILFGDHGGTYRVGNQTVKLPKEFWDEVKRITKLHA